MFSFLQTDFKQKWEKRNECIDNIPNVIINNSRLYSRKKNLKGNMSSNHMHAHMHDW